MLIPEIVLLIAGYLSSGDLYSCVLVSRAWHAMFVTVLWKDMTISRYYINPSPAAMQQHAHLVHQLRIEHCPEPECFDMIYDHLHTLQLNRFLLTKAQNATKEAYLALMVCIVQRNPSLRSITLRGSMVPTRADFWQACIQTLRALNRLEVVHVGLSYDSFDSFWKMVGRSRNVRLDAVDFPKRSSNTEFGNLQQPITRYIHIRSLSNISSHYQWCFMTQCSEATTIHWSTNDSISEAFALNLEQHLAPGTWPVLRHLCLPGEALSDKSYSVLLAHLNPLTSFSAPNSNFGKLGMEPLLKRHIVTLQLLDLSLCKHVASPYIQDMLSSGPLLETFKAHTLRVTCLDPLRSRPWVCVRMVQLKLSFDIRGYEEGKAHELIFRRLAGLQSLQELDISRGDFEDELPLKLHVGLGLDWLSVLKGMECLSIDRTRQSLKLKDVQWMKDHWYRKNPSFRVIGALHPERHQDEFLREIFTLCFKEQ